MPGPHPSIIYEDNHIIAVNKMPSDIAQGDKTGDLTLADRVKEYIREKYGKKGEVFLGVVHRLDRPVSGVLLYARTSKALARLNALFREGGVQKLYWAVVREKPPKDEDTLTHFLTRNPKLNKSFASDRKTPASRQARLRYRLLCSLERYRVLEVELLTGRHHQIRAQLAAIGCHIKGDLKYGAERSNPGGGIHLHAREVSFTHPVRGKRLRIVADPPADAVWDAALRLLKARKGL
jgi:23S rRNA pseudouridine1911/1915/1917 synthase